MARKRPPMTPEQKAAKAARERERYQKAKAAGLTPDQARSLKKTLQNQPEILQEPTEALLDLMGMVRGAVDWLSKPMDEPKKVGRTSQPKPRTSGGRTSAPKERKPSPPRRAYDDFQEFARSRPGVPANEIIRQYRARGGSIGNEKGKDLIRDVFGKEKEKSKATRFRYHTNDEKPIFGGTKHLIKARYMYLMQFEVEQQDAADTRTDWIYISSDTPRTLKELKELTLDAWADGYNEGKDKERYNSIRIVPESIELIHAVDTRL